MAKHIKPKLEPEYYRGGSFTAEVDMTKLVRPKRFKWFVLRFILLFGVLGALVYKLISK